MSWQRAAVHRQRAVALEARGRSEEAVHAYRDTLRCDPQNADAQLRLGLLLRELGRDDEANQAFVAAQRLHSGAPVARPLQQALSWAPDAEPGARLGARSDKMDP